MRILSVGLHPPHTGGIATATSYLKRHLEERGHEVVVLTYDFPKRRFSGARFMLKVILNAGIVKREKIDIIHAHYLAPPGLAGLFLKWMHGVPLVISAHGSDVNYLSRNVVGNLLCRLVVQFSDALIANSASTQRRLAELGGQSTVIHLGVDAKRFFPRNEKREAILYVGALTENKRVSDLIEAACGLGTIWIVGDGPERRNLENLASRLGCDCAFFGYREEVERFMSRAYVLVLPSPKEGFGLTALEALSCGTPVIAKKGSGLEEILPEHLLFSDEAEMKRMIGRFMESEALRISVCKDMGAAIGRFRWEETAEKTESEYIRACEKGHHKTPVTHMKPE